MIIIIHIKNLLSEGKGICFSKLLILRLVDQDRSVYICILFGENELDLGVVYSNRNHLFVNLSSKTRVHSAGIFIYEQGGGPALEIYHLMKAG